jgi:hypothetical protein
MKGPGVGLSTRGSGSEFATWLLAFGSRYRIKEALRKAFANAAEDFMSRLQRIEQFIGAIRGALPVSHDEDSACMPLTGSGPKAEASSSIGGITPASSTSHR